MNMYTDPEYRRKGIAIKTLDMLIKEAKKRGITRGDCYGPAII